MIIVSHAVLQQCALMNLCYELGNKADSDVRFLELNQCIIAQFPMATIYIPKILE